MSQSRESPKPIIAFFIHPIMGDNKTISFQNILLDNIETPNIQHSFVRHSEALNSNSDIFDNKEITLGNDYHITATEKYIHRQCSQVALMNLKTRNMRGFLKNMKITKTK